MIIYFSGGGVRGVWQEVNERLLSYGGARLISFAYKRLLFDFCELCKELNAPCKLLVDSGAFTAWSKGEEVNREELADCFKQIQDGYSHLLDLHLINLDRIPGRKGVDPTPEQIDDAMLESMQNFEYLNALFPDKVLPVYHQGEPQSFLDAMVSDYICLSPRNDVPEHQRRRWAQQAHTPTKKYHGLATTGIDMMETVNWHSVDSAGWVMVGGMGSIFYPVAKKLQPLAVSSKSNMLKVPGKHVDTMHEKEAITAYVTERGFNYDELQTNDRARYIWNMEHLVDFQNAYTPRHYYEKGLFDL